MGKRIKKYEEGAMEEKNIGKILQYPPKVPWRR